MTAKIWRWPLHWQVLLGLVIGGAAGYAVGHWAIGQIPGETPPDQRGAVAAGIFAESWFYLIFDLIGDLFLNGLKMIIVPLVTSSIILAVYGMGGGAEFGKLGFRTLLYYMTTSVIAVLIGLTLINLVSPGTGSDGAGILVGQDLSAFEQDQQTVEQRTGGKTGSDFLDVFRQMLPENVIAAAAQGQLLGLITVSLFVGFFLTTITGGPQGAVADFTQGVYSITLRIVDVVLRLAPIGVLALVATTVGEQFAKLAPDARFAEFLAGIAKFALVAATALTLHLFVSMPLILMFVARVNPIRHYKAMLPAMITAFSTSSSSATLPVTMECVQDRAGVSPKTTSFVLPLGATVNMDGTALYECVAAIFICQAFGVELSFAQQFMIVVVAVLTSIGVAGVPSASLVAIIVILEAVQQQLPAEVIAAGIVLTKGMGLLFVFDRPLDMYRTVVNIFSDSVGAVVIAKTRGETPLSAPVGA